MKKLTLKTICVFILIHVSIGKAWASGEVDSIYLGQPQPNDLPVKFAPGLISTENLEIEGVFHPSMTEFYFTRQIDSGEIMTITIEKVGDKWEEKSSTPRIGEVSFSYDGNIMFLGNKFRKRTKEGWSDVEFLDPKIKNFPVMRATSSALGTLFFDERSRTGKIRYVEKAEDVYSAPTVLPNSINAGIFTAHPFIAKDESYLIFDSEREDGFGDSDLYISFKLQNGQWSKAINMGNKINTEHEDAFGTVSPDGKYFFFHRIEYLHGQIAAANIYWVDASFLNALRSKIERK